MRYFGGKTQTCKYIAQKLDYVRLPNQIFMSPFVGGGWVECLVEDPKFCYDKHYYLIEMYKKLQEGWKPPQKVSKEQYLYIKEHKDEKPYLTGFVGFGCSFAGKWFGGYADEEGQLQDKKIKNDSELDKAKRFQDRNFCYNAYNSVLEKMKGFRDTVFECHDYRELKPNNMLIYCDPPYCGTSQYSREIVGDFDHNEFWNIMREWGKSNTVLISEYSAPKDFHCVWSSHIKTDMNTKDNKKISRTEKLFSTIDIEPIKDIVRSKSELFSN